MDPIETLKSWLSRPNKADAAALNLWLERGGFAPRIEIRQPGTKVETATVTHLGHYLRVRFGNGATGRLNPHSMTAEIVVVP